MEFRSFASEKAIEIMPYDALSFNQWTNQASNRPPGALIHHKGV
jgi:hypothetical protein